jgi:23S rRNA maturation-related 3'-5' exoribonuclease YhaM
LRLQNILQQRFARGGMTPEMKRIVLDLMEESKSLKFVREKMAEMEKEIEAWILKIEQTTMVKNYVLRLLVERLKVY